MALAFLCFSGIGLVLLLVSVRVTGVEVVLIAMIPAVATSLIAIAIRRKVDRQALLWNEHAVTWVIVVGLGVLAINAILGIYVHTPFPSVRDEFSYLLAADTFAHGRLTNATHSMMEHFRAAHIILEPTYQSKYPPAQGVVLAFGQAVFGKPEVGVWVSLSIGCSALLWMLQGWLPNRWALFGTFIFLVNFEVIRYWGQSYWGGAVALTGGALVFGALPRLLSELKVGTSVILGLGVLILAFSRPFEGMLACIPVFVLLLFWMCRKSSPPVAESMRKLVAPIFVLGVLSTALMAQFNYAVTGDVWRMPYQVYLDQQGADITGALLSPFREAPTQQPIIENESIALDLQAALKKESIARERSEARAPLAKLARQYHFYVGVALIAPFLFVPFTIRRRWSQFAILTCAFVLAGVYSNSAAGYPHYLAPIACLLTLLLVQGARYLNVWLARRLRSDFISIGLLPLFALCLSLATLVMKWIPAPVHEGYLWSIDRLDIEQRLIGNGDQHLVVVRYAPDHPFYEEWIYNKSDIDNSAVVWARELSPTKNRKLLQYFSDREVWLLDVDATNGPLITPYDSQSR